MISGRLWRLCVALVVAFVLTAGSDGAAAVGRDASGGAGEMRWHSWLEEDARALRWAATRMAETRLAEPFAAMEDRVPAYGDWVYGWMSSIYIGLGLAGDAAWSAGRQVWSTGSFNPDALVADLESSVARAFDAQVVRPVEATAALEARWAAVIARLQAFDRRLAADRLARGAPAEVARPWLDDWAPGVPAALRRGPRAIFTGDGVDYEKADLILARSVRPISTRVLSSATRMIVVPLTAMAGGAAFVPVVDITTFGGANVFSGALVTGLWTMDFAINWADTVWNRPGFEAELVAAIRAQRDLSIVGARELLAASLADRLPTP